MKALFLVTALAAAVALVSAPAEAAKKRKKVAMAQPTTVAQDSHMVRDADGEILGSDPDPFIRLMIRKEGRIRDQSGR